MKTYAIIITILFLPLILQPAHTYEHILIPQIDLPVVEVRPVNYKDVELIARLIRSEDCNQGFESNAIVAQTVVHKMQKYNTTAYGAIFKTYRKGKAYYGAYTDNFYKKPLEVHLRAAEMVLKGYRPAPEGIAYFIGDNDNPNTKWYKYIKNYAWKQVGYHTYCFDPKYKP